MKNFLNTFKKDPVLFISGFLAFVSCFIIPPSKEYLNYIDVRVLALLFCLMAIVAGMKEAGAFELLSNALLKKINSLRKLVFTFVSLCFFLSMFLTNDVALVTIVPFTILVFSNLEKSFSEIKKSICITLILETISANLGSMLTPIGNPQNLFLFSAYNISLKDFIFITIPYTLISFLVLCILSFTLTKNIKFTLSDFSNKNINLCKSEPENFKSKLTFGGKLSSSFYIYLSLFIFALLSVARILNWIFLLGFTLLELLTIDRKLLKKVDYSLLLTFLFFFIFVGNMGKLDALKNLLENLIEGREVLLAILTSQIISNVPAALLLSSFTENGTALVIGTNLGGLGTIIASMASLITYKFCEKEYKTRYLLIFSLINLLMLLFLYGTYFFFFSR